MFTVDENSDNTTMFVDTPHGTFVLLIGEDGLYAYIFPIITGTSPVAKVMATYEQINNHEEKIEMDIEIT